MSEYQYYEFLSIDKPLTQDDMDVLRGISSRATITPVSFTNEYNWGDFKGDPDKLMLAYFDAHVYVANWMSARFMVRLPIEALDKKTVHAFAVPYVLDFEASQTHWVVTWSLDESEDYDRFGMEDRTGWMARLTPIRDELLRGDLRSLYIGWLASVYEDMAEDDEEEPMFVGGLGNLTPAQKALVEFLEVEPDLLSGASLDSPEIQNEETPQKLMDEWIAALPKDDIIGVLKQLLEGKGHQVERTIRTRFLVWRRSQSADDHDVPRRSVAELWKNAEKAKLIRTEKEKHARKLREEKRRKERDTYLNNLSNDYSKAWKSVAMTLERKSGQAYDEACRGLVDISEAYALQKNTKAFQKEMKQFMAKYSRRWALIQHLVKAGLWKDK
ncbi:MAG: hypothetical protein KKD44_15015 [Proteobacteria bacterium]|nr:hypothetical protein [Pseudomonadota bacterium]